MIIYFAAIHYFISEVKGTNSEQTHKGQIQKWQSLKPKK